MQNVTLGMTGLSVSRLAFGTWQLGGDWGPFQEKAAIAAINGARDVGVNFFDTAQAYGFGASEELLGRALHDELSSNRDRVIIATKGGLRRTEQGTVRDASPAWLRTGVEQSLRALGTDYIDLYQIHWPDPATPIAETAAALQRLVEEGKIRHVGVSNFSADQIAEFARTRPVETVQPAYHVFRRDIERDLLPYTRANNIGVLAYGPLAHGPLGGHITETTSFVASDWRGHSPLFRGETLRRNLAVVDELERFAEKLRFRVSQLAVAWVLSEPGVHVAIIGSRNEAHVREAADAVDRPLTAQERAQIDEIISDAVPVAGRTPETT